MKWTGLNEIREKYLTFFESKGHLRHKSFPLVPINDKSILKALDIIHENFNTPLTVENIAKQCFMNKDYLIRKFSKLVGLTPYAYIKRLRILNARRLRSQGLTLSEIAVKTGYSDAASVSHALKKY